MCPIEVRQGTMCYKEDNDGNSNKDSQYESLSFHQAQRKGLYMDYII
jgi:hypothetical protein